MDIIVEPRKLADLDVPGNLLQSGFWGAFKAADQEEAFGFFVRTRKGAFPLMLLLRPLGGIRYGYVPHGPAVSLPEPLQGPLLEALSEALRTFLPGECRFLRYDTLWASPYTDEPYYDESGNWTGPPGTLFREMRMNAGCESWSLRKAATDLQPTDTVLVDLMREEDEILMAMRPNTRNLIRRSYRAGVRVRNAPAEELPRWYRLYRETAERKGFRAQEPEYFENLFELASRWGSDEAGANALPYVRNNQFEREERRNTEAPDLRFLTAEMNNGMTAGVIIAFHGARAYYLYAAMSPDASRYSPSYALQWEAIRAARHAGCAAYDLYGIPPNNDPSHPMHGLYRFKTGFGGRIVHRRGCWDYPFDPERYEALRGIEPTLGGYHV